MSEPIVDKVRQVAAEAAVATAWAQWGRLGFLASGGESHAGDALIDPEALLVLTLDAVRWEPRLDQVLDWWAVRGAGLLSLPRVDYVLREVAVDLKPEVGGFAARMWGAKTASGSWKTRARDVGLAAKPPPDRLKGAKEPRLKVPQSLMLRNRALSTLGAKADVLSYLMSLAGRPATVARMVKALGYAEDSIRSAVSDLQSVGVVATEQRRTPAPGRDPARYAFQPGLVNPEEAPEWRFWAQIVGFLLATARWGEALKEPTSFLYASRARQLYDRLNAFRTEHSLPAAYPIADPARYPGESYLEPFAETVDAVAAWLAAGLPAGSPTPDDATEPFHVPPFHAVPNMVSLSDYLDRIEATLRTGDATEHSHRPALQALLEGAGLAALGRPPSVVNEPKRTAVGAPDFVVRLAGVPLGYVEAKDVGVALDAETEQLRRYRAGLRNLLFTDGLTVRWFADGAERDSVTLADREGDGPTVTLHERDGAAEALADLLGAFFRFEGPTITSARDLATRMAAATRLLRLAIERSFEAEDDGGALHRQFQAFRDVLVHGLTEAAFADMYAQTLAYGLFAARTADPEAAGFSRLTAAAHLPRTNPFLRRLFYEVAGPDLDERIAWLVDDLATLLARADLARILRDFGKRTRQVDAVVHFYETFLQAYDADLRDARGVFYTPEPVVGYLVRSVDAVLARDFELADGLADATKVAFDHPETADGPARTEQRHRVQVLDPATGTGTFLHAVLRTIHARFEGNEGMWDAYVADHLLPRLHGFELLMAPYTVAHLKLGLFLKDTGYTFSRDERLNVFLTNALDGAPPATEIAIPFARWLADEASAADRVKRDTPVMVVLGNPPYSGHSANTGDWITKLMRGHDTHTGRPTENYFEVDGGPLGERNSKWLNDDYVKFVRMAQEQVVRTGAGVVAFVTNHGFLDNPTFRGMRQSLMTAFDRLYLLDLHGNAKKKETTPEGGRDENVFDIMQGVSLAVMVRLPDHDPAAPAEVFHADLWGARADKYAALDAVDVTGTDWTRIDPQTPRYLFREVDREFRDEYDEGWSVTEILPVSNTGMVTARDRFVLGFGREEVLERVLDFAALPLEEAASKYKLRDTRELTLTESQKMVRGMGDPGDRMQTVLYRPFDERAIFYDQALVRWPATGVMHHMIDGENLGLITTRQTRDDWDALVTEHPIGHKALAAYDINTLFPLWRYPDPGADLFAAAAPQKEANLAPGWVAALAEATGLGYAEHGPEADDAFTPEDAFHYVYGVLHTPSYRARYADFLKTDYPRVPLPPDAAVFRAFAEIGRRLVALHLLRETPAPGTRFPVKGSNVVEKGYPTYAPPGEPGPDGETADDGRVFLNETQFVGGVEPEVWGHEVGGYQVLDKWLKDRRGRALSYDDLRRYAKIVAALRETQRVMAEADVAAEKAFGW